MKKIYSLILSSAFAFVSLNAGATTHNVSVGAGGNTFTPAGFTAVVGDVVIWTLSAGTHTVNSIPGSVPGGAAAINSGTMSVVGSTYSYTITVAGNYGYQCNFHGNLAGGTGMIGGFTVSATGILEPATDLLMVNAYPNPFTDKITVAYGKQVQSIKIFNVVGAVVKSMDLSTTDEKVDVDFEGIPAGMYFIRTYKEGVVVETKKIIKSK